MSNWHIPFNRPTLLGSELDYMRAALEGGPPGGAGDHRERTERLLEALLQVERVLLTPSCTAALEMAALLLNLAPGDEVIVPSFTFVSTANAFHQFGARIVFADVRPDTLNLDEAQVARLITSRTRAVVPVHYAGVAANMEPLTGLDVPIIEDNAHGLFGRYQGRFLGSLGCAATLSFHETKNFTCGEGGALILNDPGWIDRAEILRENGTNRRDFLRRQVDQYTWVDRGSSYRLSEVAAANLLAQLERHEEVQSRRRKVWTRYAEALSAWASRHRFRLPYIPPGCEQGYHMFYLLAPDRDARDRMIAHLGQRGIQAVFHYAPLHSSLRGRACGHAPLGCPVSEDLAARLLRLPFFTGLSIEDQDEVIRAIEESAP